MKEIKFNKAKDFNVNELMISPETWEKIKKAGDLELYKKFNKYADYEELRIYITDRGLDLEAHCIKSDAKESSSEKVGDNGN